MLDDPPQDPHDDAGWFRHFRMTKYLPAVAGKFDAALRSTESDALAARAVMTAYAATALDILMHVGTPPARFAAELGDTFNLTPEHLLLLQVADFSRLSRRGEVTLGETLAQAGFLVDGGTVVGFRLPQDAPRPGRRPPPKP